jgi:transcriptional regulator GlxA family with amidase domain
MNRTFAAIIIGAALCMPNVLTATTALTPPAGRDIRVAFVLTQGATMIDFAGPWEVFQDVMTVDRPDSMVMPFSLFTVGESKAPIRISGGMTVVPEYTFANAPPADVVVVGAQRGAPGLKEFLQARRKRSTVVMSVCTGAFKLAEAGLFDGKEATTHHEFTDRLASRYPKVKVVTSRRYVQADPVVFSAGGLTSGIDLALHVVELYFGREVAERTAKYMEYESTGWKDVTAKN